MFTLLYDRMIGWSKHPRAMYWLAIVSFSEAIFFPLPPDIMLIMMTLADHKRSLQIAWIALLSSVLGGLIGYGLGYMLLDFIYPYMTQLGYGEAYTQVKVWFEVWGFWVLLAAGFSPVPYKLFTVAAGAMHVHMGLFLLAILFSRGARFLLVTTLVAHQRSRIDQKLRYWANYMGWGLALGLIAVIIYKLL